MLKQRMPIKSTNLSKVGRSVVATPLPTVDTLNI